MGGSRERPPRDLGLRVSTPADDGTPNRNGKQLLHRAFRPRHRAALAALRNRQTDALNEILAETFAGHFKDHEPLSDDALANASTSPAEQVVKGAAY